MCGIVGFLNRACDTTPEQLHAIVTRMADTLVQRGPDDSGVWVHAPTGIALGHRRLAILDLSSRGHQPMLSTHGRFCLVFNGEIYNFRALRRELESCGHAFRGHSDTEVMLAAFDQWGVVDAVKRFNGMFAFALWDTKDRILHLARDRMGEKPLYYGWVGTTFLFASELKAIRMYPDFQGEIDRGALSLYLRYRYVPTPYSIYQGIGKLPAGTLLSLPWDHAEHGHDPACKPIPYWSVSGAVANGALCPFVETDHVAIAQLDELLRDAVKLRLESDVPLGAFLSGGIDSSTVVALMQAQAHRPVRTFSIGFGEDDYNEAEHAKAVARHLGTEHTELYVRPDDAMAVIPRLPTLYDEPFAASSQIPMFLMAQMARQHVTVCLSGDGGDELFGGYNRHFLGRSIWQNIRWIPVPMRRVVAQILTVLPPETWNRFFHIVGCCLRSPSMPPNPAEKLSKLANILVSDSPEDMYRNLVSVWKQQDAVVAATVEPETMLAADTSRDEMPDYIQRMMFLDTVTYLPDEILVKVDRASMGVSLEARVPLLDHRVVEFAWQLPFAMKIRYRQGKWLLRQVLYKYVPQELVSRPKTGFAVPIDSWIRGPLRPWAESLLNEKRIRQEGFLNPEPILTKWKVHLSGKRDCHDHLWNILMFQAWLETQ